MPRSKAGFKARRETLGLSQQDVADELEVSVRTVKRWEHPDWQEPPEDAWTLIERYEAIRREAIEESERAFLEDDYDGTKNGAVIAYYRTQDDYDAYGRDEGPYGFANANARAVAESIGRMGYEVKFVYPERRGEIVPID